MFTLIFQMLKLLCCRRIIPKYYPTVEIPRKALMTRVTATLFSLLALSAHISRANETTASKSSQPAPLPSWTGFYAGINAGRLWNNSSGSAPVDWSGLTLPGNFANSAAFTALPEPNFAWSNSAGFLGGGQIGYNWQVMERVVVGVETDFQGVTGEGSNWNSGSLGSSSTHTPNSIGSVRGRAGYLVALKLQIYGTGGIAYSR
jgi:outer membrane immunogenic protein